MRTAICEEYGMDVPVFAFSHSVDVVIAVSNAGGMGVLGASGMTPQQLDDALRKITNACPGKAFGVDLILPNNYVGKDLGGLDYDSLQKQIPQGHKDFVEEILQRYGIGHATADSAGIQSAAVTSSAGESKSLKGARMLADVAFAYPIKLLVNALGILPEQFRDTAHSKGIKVGALVGKVKHAIYQKEAGVDLIIAQGYEAGGHTGEISSLVLTPQIVDAVAPIPVLCAGGVADGRQFAAALALGAQGVWTGSVWLTTKESETHPAVKEKLKRAESSDTIRSRSRTGKPARQIRSAWTDIWDDPSTPQPLPMPVQGALIRDALIRIEVGALKGEEGAMKLINYFAGQNVGMLTEERPAAQVLMDMVQECNHVLEQLGTLSVRESSMIRGRNE